MGVRALLTVLLLFVATVKAEELVSFWREKFTMICGKTGKWYHNYEKFGEDQDNEVENITLLYNHNNKGLYHCEYDDIKEYFYVKGKVCEQCFELDPTVFALIIVVDVLMTVLIMISIYKCTKKRGSDGPSSKAPARSGGHGPPVPSVDYEQLNPNTRSLETYSIVNRTG